MAKRDAIVEIIEVVDSISDYADGVEIGLKEIRRWVETVRTKLDILLETKAGRTPSRQMGMAVEDRRRKASTVECD